MEAWTSAATDLMWRNAIAVVPLALLVGLLCRWLPSRPSTRHMLWLVVLVWFILPVALPALRAPNRADEGVARVVEIPGEDEDAPSGRGESLPDGRGSDEWASEVSDAGSTSSPLPCGRGSAGGETEVATATDVLINKRSSRSRHSAGATAPLRSRLGSEARLGSEEIAARINNDGTRERAERHTSKGRAADAAHEPPVVAEAKRRWDQPTRQEPQQPTAAPFDTSGGPSETAAADRLRPRRHETLGPDTGDETPVGGGHELARAALASEPDSAPPGVALNAASRATGARDLNIEGSGIGGRGSGGERSRDREIERSRSAVANSARNAAGPDDVRRQPAGVGTASGDGEATASTDEQPSTAAWIAALANERLRAWLVGLAGVRDALGRLPSVPPLFWFSGAIVLGMMLAVRFAKFRKLMAGARPAPREVEALVRLVADHIGLRVAPRAYLVDARISPMIYCGRATRLLIPVDLWNQLDRDGRLAILSHELAHVRRRDHWVCWIETFIGCLFWWHPVLWWVRRRLHEEAEYCCDAWVTWLMPHGRRAYAEALLHAKTYLAGHRGCAPAVGVGMTTTRTQRFARRLKMVMTDRSKPELSLAGLTLVVALASAGWAATPCPDKKVKAAKSDTPKPTVTVQPFAQPSIQTRVTTPTISQSTVTSPSAAQPTVTWRAAAPAPSALVLPSMTATWAGGDEKDIEKRLSKLEKQLEKLSKQLDKIAGGDATPSALGRAGVRSVPGVPSAPAVQSVPPVPAVRAWSGGISGGGGSPADSGAVEIRIYALPDGKLDALVQLMIRSDVPVPVAQRGGAIEVHATPAQHAVFRAFVELIHPEGKGRSATDEEGSRFGAGASAHQWQDAVAKAQRALEVNPESAAGIYSDAIKTHEEAMEVAREWQEKAREEQVTAIREAQRQQQNAMRHAQREQRMAQVEQQRAQARQRQDHADALGHEMEALERHAEELREKAESLSEEIEEIQEGDNPDKDAIRNLREQMKALEREARNIERRARDLQRQADQLRQESDRLSEEADGIQEEADEDEDGDEDGESESAAVDRTDEAVAEYAVLARALSGAARAIEDEAAPRAAEAIAGATELLRAGAHENAHGALLEAAAALAENGEAAADVAPLLRELLAESVNTKKQDAPNMVARLLEKANEAMQNGAAAEARRTLAEALKALNAAGSARAEEKEDGR